MKFASARSFQAAYLMTEALVYIGVVVALMGAAYFVTYRAIDSSVVLRRNAEDVASAMRAGERWRNDIRSATNVVSEDGVLRLLGTAGEVAYRFENNNVFRTRGGSQATVLSHVKTSSMQPDPRKHVTAWRWELELLPRAKGYTRASRIAPLFSFAAVPTHKEGT